MAQAKTSQPKFLPRIENSSNTYVATAGGNPFDEAEDEEIFSKRRMTLNIPSNCSGDLMHLIVANNWLFCLLSAEGRLTLLRFFLPRAIPPGRELSRFISITYLKNNDSALAYRNCFRKISRWL